MNPNVSGMCRFVTDELGLAEDNGQGVWILGHVLPGAWLGYIPVPSFIPLIGIPYLQR
jgi:sphingomyelin phosphodiesterase